MTEVIEGGPWLFQGQPIVLQRWQPGMALRKLKHTEVPVWIKLKHLPVEYWTEEGLSVVASGIGKPLYPDAITKACMRLDFARVCVMLNISSKLPKHIVILAPIAEGGKVPCKVDVEYKWVPKKCVTCMSLGHSASSCPTTQHSTKKPVNIFVQKVRTVDATVHGKRVPSLWGRNRDTRLPSLLVSPPSNVRIRIHPQDHQKAVLDLIFDYKLQFIGILETRVSSLNASRVQTFTFPRLKCFFDYSVLGTRIWVAWNEDELDVDILLVHAQFIHCKIFICGCQKVVFVMVVYGDNEVVPRRDLWHELSLLASSIVDDPWLVLGDFNAVMDMSEVCENSGDIRVAMEDFCACILDTGLISLPICRRHLHWPVINEFVGFFQQLLGGERRSRAMDLRYLRPWASRIITDEEARTLTAPVTRTEIKQAFFDIEEDKAPGPVGYSAGFYKAAWPVIGEEIMVAVEEFFTNGCLLKQVNATLVALIPKVQSPMTVADFRPISCCNVLYKAITKILVQRLRPLLSRLVSPTQNAFIPGRLISDNILLAQELFAGYNQQRTPPRCAMKVDLRKAYDKVKWDFLLVTL
ncbi:UNVERIFIED_CONTAM: hypothetical protein Slati_3098100 [Sesamum latifolium]|uniref:Reverse transcriptase domain-containing protein n=1 Tax=Sesamum latifolium TaxID=2727402 RepID=A0AAW2UW77_9LAMI